VADEEEQPVAPGSVLRLLDFAAGADEDEAWDLEAGSADAAGAGMGENDAETPFVFEPEALFETDGSAEGDALLWPALDAAVTGVEPVAIAFADEEQAEHPFEVPQLEEREPGRASDEAFESGEAVDTWEAMAAAPVQHPAPATLTLKVTVAMGEARRATAEGDEASVVLAAITDALRAVDGDDLTVASAGEAADAGCVVVDLGRWGIEEGVAPLAPGAACSFAVGAVRELPAIVAGRPTIAPVTTVTMTCDAERIPLEVAAELLARVRDMVESPAMLLAA
jgi:hypothetical protein